MTEPMADWPPATVEAPVGADPWSAFPQNVNFMPTLQPIDTYFWQAGWFQIAILSVCGLVILISLRLTAQLSLQRKEQLLLQQERARIARDIHDDVGSRMTQLVLNGEVMQSELSSDSSLRPQLDRICQEAREVLSTMDEILWAVNPRRDTLRDFSSYVCSYAENFLKSTPIQCLFEVDTEMSFAALDLPRRRSLLMAIKETLNNVAKHSGATELKLQIQCQNGILVVVVQDNGRGFDPANARSGRNGLGNLNLRIGELGGNCVITSQPGQGCRVEFVIPLETPRPFRWHWPWEEKNEVKPPGGKNLRLNEAAESYDPTKC
jgi:signal transduction histidine kinase